MDAGVFLLLVATLAGHTLATEGKEGTVPDFMCWSKAAKSGAAGRFPFLALRSRVDRMPRAENDLYHGLLFCKTGCSDGQFR